ncbi:MAG: 3D domain-containing protein [Acidobacteriota bacterium]
MKQETYRASRLLWFTTLLLAFSVSILYFTVAITPATMRSFNSITTQSQELEPSPEPPDPPGPPNNEANQYTHFVATAYSVRGTTASGVTVNTGIVAADPDVLPIGSVIELKLGSHSGIYTVLDTGGFIKGNRIDIYVPDSDQALEFGRRQVKIRVLRHGWNIAPL